MNYALMGEIGGGVEERGCYECHNCFVKRLAEELEAARAWFLHGKSTVSCRNRMYKVLATSF